MHLTKQNFSFLFATACLFSLADEAASIVFLIATGQVALSPILASLVLVSGLISVSRSDSTRLHQLLCISWLLYFLNQLPWAPNHRHLLAFLALYSLFNPKEEHLLSFIQKLGGLVYAFATFWKLNDSFLFEEYSCGRVFYLDVASYMPILYRLDASVSVIATIVIEGLFAFFLLSFRRVPKSILYLGILFHFGLALDIGKYFMNFSLVMGCIWLPLLGVRVSLQRVLGKYVVFSILAALVLVTIYFRSFDTFSVRFLYSLLGFPILALAVWYVGKSPVTGRQSTLGIFILLLVVVHGLAPWIGLKTRTSFNMYSNLYITDINSNHLLIPRSLDVFGFLAERVVVVDSNVPNLDLNQELVRVEVLQRVSRTKDGYAATETGEVLTDHTVPYLRSKLLHRFSAFRSLQKTDECVW